MKIMHQMGKIRVDMNKTLMTLFLAIASFTSTGKESEAPVSTISCTAKITDGEPDPESLSFELKVKLPHFEAIPSSASLVHFIPKGSRGAELENLNPHKRQVKQSYARVDSDGKLIRFNAEIPFDGDGTMFFVEYSANSPKTNEFVVFKTLTNRIHRVTGIGVECVNQVQLKERL